MFLNRITVLLCAVASFALADDSDVMDLSSFSKDDFVNELSKHGTVLVEFFAPWCGHCKRLAPAYSKAATSLLANDPPVPLAKVDCTSDLGKDICSSYDVSGYPTLKIFKNGKFDAEYDGPREADGIVKYMKSRVGPASYHLSSFTALDEKLKKSKEVMVVGIFKSESDSLVSKFLDAADKSRDVAAFAHIYSESATDDVAKLTTVSITFTAPSVLLVRPQIMKNKFEENAIVWDESTEMKDWILRNYHGLVGHRTQTNMASFEPPLVVVYYDVDYVKNAKGTNYWRNRVLKVAQKYSDVHFAVSNSQAFGGEMDEYGLEADKSARDAVPVVGARDANRKKYVLKEKFSVEVLDKFVKDFVAGKLEPHLKSEEMPENNDGPVKVAVGKNFDELVTNTKKDVFIEFYAPWCGHCKKLAPTYEELGEALKDEENIEIVKMDATANDVPSLFEVSGFPTMYWYPSGTKQPKRYDGGREKEEFIKFIAKHATIELNGYDRDGKTKKTEL